MVYTDSVLEEYTCDSFNFDYLIKALLRGRVFF